MPRTGDQTIVLNRPTVHRKFYDRGIGTPLLLRLLPTAKMVYMRRDERDVALSLFRQGFDYSELGVPWATEPQYIRGYIDAHARAMQARAARACARRIARRHHAEALIRNRNARTPG